MMTISDLFGAEKPVQRIFLSGKITGDPGYRVKFSKAAYLLEQAGFAVMNPAMLPSEGFTHAEYLKVTLAMLSVCDAVCLLPDWIESKGAQMEIEEATRAGQEIFTFEEWKSEFDRRLASA